jgi:hypothetical protein
MSKRDAERLYKNYRGCYVRLPVHRDEALWRPTRDVADMFDVSTRTITEYVRAGMPKAGRDLFYLPDCVNFVAAKKIADALRMQIEDVARGSVIDFSLGRNILQLEDWDQAEAYIKCCRDHEEKETP